MTTTQRAVGGSGNTEKPSTGFARAGSAPLAVLDTSVNLAGEPCAQTLMVYEDWLEVVADDDREPTRWRLSCIEEFRIESTVGSCFLQAQIKGQWIDLLRFPGNGERGLVDLVDRLNSRPSSRIEDQRCSEAERCPDAAVSRWFSRSRSDEGNPPRRSWRSAARVLAIMRPFRGTMLLLFGLSLAAVLIELAPPYLLGILVDVLKAEHPELEAHRLTLLLLTIVAGLLVIRVTSTLVTIWKGRIASRVGTTLTANLREELVRKLNELPLAFHDRNQVGMLMSRVAYDTENLHTLLHHLTSGLLLQSLQLVGIGVMLFYLNAKLALVTMLPMPLILAGGWYFTRYLNPRHQHYWEAVGKQASALMGMLSGIRVVKAFVQEDREVERFSASSRRLRDARQTVDFSTVIFTAIMGLLFALGNLAVWYLGGYDVLFGSMMLGSLVSFIAYLAMFYTPLTTIAESTTWFSSFFTAVHRIFDLLETPSEAEESGDAELPPTEGGVEFRGVSFGYDKTRPVLKEIDFLIQPGEMVGIVGRSGSGKSTLVSLIARLYEADAGEILLDGIDVRDVSARQLRRQIGMVPQEPFLFRGTIAENIAYGNATAAPEGILRAASQADAHDFILRKPLAYETQLGEGGLGLSGGERQRLSIARALLYDPAILILDEATASVDAESERAICDAIRRFSRRRTTIVIAHRLSTLRDADRLLVFDLGRLIEAGTHETLLAHGGLYATLVRLQSNLRESRHRMQSVVGGSATANGHGSVADLASREESLDVFPADDTAGDRHGGPRAECDHESGVLCWLDPATARIADDGYGLLAVMVEGREYRGVQAIRVFPASHERAFISLVKREASGRETELGILCSLDEWPEAAERAVLRSLGRRYLLRRILEIRSLRTSGNQLILSVVDDGGPRRLQLEKPGEGFQPFGEHGLLLVDEQGGYFVIPDRRALPKRQQRLLNLYFGD